MTQGTANNHSVAGDWRQVYLKRWFTFTYGCWGPVPGKAVTSVTAAMCSEWAEPFTERGRETGREKQGERAWMWREASPVKIFIIRGACFVADWGKSDLYLNIPFLLFKRSLFKVLCKKILNFLIVGWRKNAKIYKQMPHCNITITITWTFLFNSKTDTLPVNSASWHY